MVSVDNIKRNSRDFSFVDTLGSFINNYEFSQGYEAFKQTGDATKEGYIWSVLSAIGGNYAETIYENVLNYIDNVSNVDLCKVKNLQSMIKILGIDYNVINDVEAMPVELVNLVDILSINKHYLLDNKTFSSAFISELSSYDEGKCLVSADFVSTLSSDISAKYADDGETVISAKDVLASYSETSSYLDNEKYYSFLTAIYHRVLTSFVFMKYADAEAGLTTKKQYIYEYISDKLLARNNMTTSTDDPYDKEIRQLKTKYRLEKFKQDEVVDAIENGEDYLERYNAYEQIVLKKEIERRNASYPYEKSYLADENDIGFSITRFSYYREKKVKEYFDFIENTYNSLIRPDEIYSSVLGTGTTKIEVYDKDENYFNVDQVDKKNLLWYDNLSKSYNIQPKYINAIAEMLADQTLELADIRDQVKIQLRKSYLKGTFLLLSYIINEYLKYNISKHYGDVFFTEDENIALSTFIDKSIREGDNVELIEYFDQSEYFNVSSDTDETVESDLSSSLSVAIKNKNLLNEKFWDNLNSKLGETTEDLPLGEIDNFYRKTLKMNQNAVETSANLVNFLSILYSYGANDTFWDENHDTLSSKGQFMCQVQSQDLSGREWIGDIDLALSTENEKKQLIQDITDEVNQQIANGYQLSLDTVQQQLDSLSTFVSSYWVKEISSANADLKDSIIGEYESYQDTISQTSSRMLQVSSDYRDLSGNGKYKEYLQRYEPPAGTQDHFYDELTTFRDTCEKATRETEVNGVKFANDALIETIESLSTSYLSVYSNLSNLIEKYVKEEGFWPNYFTNASDEITSQTRDLATFLQNEAGTATNAILQHQQNHLDMLISYKNEAEDAINRFYETSALFTAFKEQVFAKTNTTESGGSQSFDVWVVEKILTNPKGEPWYHDGAPVYWSGGVQRIPVEWNPINSSDPIFKQLSDMNDRCNKEFYYQAVGSRYVAAEYDSPIGLKTAYVNSTVKKWADAFSVETEATIKSNLQGLRTKFVELQTMINCELSCLDETNRLSLGPISIACPSEENADQIGDTLINLFNQLLDKIKTLDDGYVKVEKFVETDKFYSTLASKITRINWILDSTPKSISYKGVTIWNIRAIDSQYAEVEEGWKQAKREHRDYLSQFSETGTGTLIQQFAELLEWMEEYDTANKREILEQIEDLITQYQFLLGDFQIFIGSVHESIVKGVSDDLAYIIEQKLYDGDTSDYLDVFLRYALEWTDEKIALFDPLALVKICEKVPELDAYKKTIDLINKLKQFLADRLEEKQYITQILQEMLEYEEQRLVFIERSRESYDAQKEIFLKYSGMDIGYDPFYNYKNMTHSSYQIHPYLYSFVEKSNLSYPLANTFFVSFTAEYERELVDQNLDDLIGKHGNIINLWKHGMFDWTGYQSQYEYAANGTDVKTIPPSFGFTGAFYPPALDDFLADSETFIQTVQDNRPESYYYKLNLTQEQLNKITEQLRIYEPAIRELVQRQKESDPLQHCLSNEYDIYKYAEDIYGNSLILFKSYSYLVESEERLVAKQAKQEGVKLDTIKQRDPDHWWKDLHGNWQYTPTYNQKKNAPGELWVRVKNHPIAFPAFDLRQEQEEYTFYDSTEDYRHEYIQAAYDYFGDKACFNAKDSSGLHRLYDVTRDCISRGAKSQQSHFRCFFDMELDLEKKTLLLVVPYQTGENHLGRTLGKLAPNTAQNFDDFCYANSNIIIGSLGQEFDYANNVEKYTFTQYSNDLNIEEVTNNIDNIKSPARLIRYSSHEPYTDIYDFIGFTKYSTCVYAVFVHKYYATRQFKQPLRPSATPQLHVYYVSYNGSKLQKYHAYQDLKYDILHKDDEAYKHANTIVLTTNKKCCTLSYISEEFQKSQKTSRGMSYTADTTVVNFAEYTQAVEKRDELSSYGQNRKYPSDTAVLQTTDAAHINIYNSFDSFTSYIVNVDLKFIGKKMSPSAVRYYNLNTDLGYLPLFADTHGKSRLYNNSALSSREEYHLEMLGPENSDVDYTPVIIDQADEKYGRVTEDWKEYDRLVTYSDEMHIPAYGHCVTCTFELSDVFVDSHGHSSYEELIETNALTNYQYVFTNTSYTALPIARGKLKDQWPLSSYYLSSEKYDLLSGQEIFGPNGVTYQGIKASNHVDNISAIQLEVKFDKESALPKAIDVSCFTRQVSDSDQVIQANKFQMLVYAKNSLGSYDYYHIIENANSQLKSNSATRMSRPEENEIVFSDISSLSDYTQASGKKPFANTSLSAKASTMSAMLEFKYSEDETIDREFPYLQSEDIEDEVVIMSNENQYIYFYQLDSFNTIDKNIFYMEKYEDGKYKRVKVNTTSRKYEDFYNRALTIEATYNVEDFGEGAEHDYEIVQYFNYKNFTSPCYVKFKKQYDKDGKPIAPEASYYSSTAKEIQHTYLVLRPGQSGRLDIQFDYVEYAKVHPTDISQSIVGKETRVVKTYYVMNVSDEKPKFIISRNPFKA